MMFLRSGIAPLIALVCGGICAASLHTSIDRSTVAWIGPIALMWGFAVILVARPPSRWAWTLLIGAILRAMFVGSEPLLSDDVYRYLWEGLAMNHGHNPFTEAPSTITGLDPHLRDAVNHPEISSIYPPLALLWFRLLDLLGGTVSTAQAVTAAADLVTASLLYKISRRAGVIYALHPLPILESAASAHIDIVAITLAVAGWLAWQRGRRGWSAALCVAGAGVKLLPGAWLGSQLRTHKDWMGAAVASAMVLLAALPVLTAGPALFHGLTAYTSHWSFNGCVFPWLFPVLGPVTRPVLIGIGAVITALACWRLTPISAALVIGATFLVLSPTVFPWYALWCLAPALASERWGLAAACTALVGGYAVLFTWDAGSQTWTEQPWLWASTWGLALTIGVVSQARREFSPTAA